MTTTYPATAQQAADAIQATDSKTQTIDHAEETPETGIIGNISDGKPGIPAPKPEPINFKVQTSLTKRVHVVEKVEMDGVPPPQGIIQVTVQMAKDPGLADPPPPPPTPAIDPAMAEKLAELSKNHRRTEHVFVSATVYNHSRSFVRCYPNGQSKKKISFWSNIDFNHLSGFGTYQVKGPDGSMRKYSLMMGLGNENTQQRAKWLAKHNRTYKAPVIPDLPDLKTGGPAFVITEGDSTERKSMEIVEGMHNLYRVDGPKMEAAYYARLKAHEERKAFLLANPPAPKDVNVHFWKRNHPLANPETTINNQEDAAQ